MKLTIPKINLKRNFLLIVLNLVFLKSQPNNSIPTNAEGSLIISGDKHFYPNSCKIILDKIQNYRFSFLVCSSFKYYYDANLKENLRNENQKEVRLKFKLENIYIAEAFVKSSPKRPIKNDDLTNHHNLALIRKFDSMKELEETNFEFLIYETVEENKFLNKEFEVTFSDIHRSDEKGNFNRNAHIKLDFLFFTLFFNIENHFTEFSDKEQSLNIESSSENVDESKLLVEFLVLPNYRKFKSEIGLPNYNFASKSLTDELLKTFKEMSNKRKEKVKVELEKNGLFRFPLESEKEEFLRNVEMIFKSKEEFDLLKSLITQEAIEKQYSNNSGGNEENEKNEKPASKKSPFLFIKVVCVLICIGGVLILSSVFYYWRKPKAKL